MYQSGWPRFMGQFTSESLASATKMCYCYPVSSDFSLFSEGWGVAFVYLDLRKYELRAIVLAVIRGESFYVLQIR